MLAYHGSGGTGPGMALLTHFSSVADKYGFGVVYPDGINKAWLINPSVDDLVFTRDLVKYLGPKYKVDARRVYATGMSNGVERLGDCYGRFDTGCSILYRDDEYSR